MRAAAIASLLAAGAAAAQPAPTPSVRFIACPIYRDTDSGRKSGCWLVEDRATGTRYDVTLAPSKPDWNHEVLVEGAVSASGSREACGGLVLDPVRTSVLPGACTRQMLPAEGYSGRLFVLPKRNVRPATLVRELPTGPFSGRTFRLLYDFDSDFLIYQYDDFFLDEALTWLRAAKPKAIAITGWAATTPVQVSGRALSEDPAIARKRAEKIADALTRLGVDRHILSVRWKTGAEPVATPEADGLAEPSRRRVDIVAAF